MPPMILWAFGGIGAAVVAKWLVREARRIKASLRHSGAATEAAEQDPRPTLRRDPTTGIYSPK
jgi:hypothetical protein